MFCDPKFDGKMIVITGGITTAAGNISALSKAPILGIDVTASGSETIEGNNPTEYVEENNDTYKWVKTVGAQGEKTPITKVMFTVEEPVAGAAPAEKVQIAAEPEGAMLIEEYDAVWLESDDGMNFTPMTTPIFKAGKYYAVEEPNEKNAGGPIIALAASGYAVPTDPEPEYTVNGGDTILFMPYLTIFGPLEDVSYSISVDPASVSISAREGYKEEDTSIYKEITATSTGTGEVDFIMAGFKEPDMYEKFGLIVGNMTATVYPKEGLKAGTYKAVVMIEDFYDRFEPMEVPVTDTISARSSGGGGGGGSSSPASYAITIEKSENGTVKANRTTAPKGARITLTLEPNEGYETDKITVTDKDGKEITVSKNSDGTYLFAMPSSKVSVKPVFKAATGVEPAEEVPLLVVTMDKTDYLLRGQKMTMDSAPFIDGNDRTMLPVRVIANALGISNENISWDKATKTASFTRADGKVVSCTVKSNVIKIGDEEVTIDTVPVIRKDRIYLPMRALFNAFNVPNENIIWDAAARTVTVTKKD